MAKSVAVEIRKLYLNKEHEKCLRAEISEALSGALKERWGDGNNAGPQNPSVAEVEEVKLKFDRYKCDEGNKYLLHMFVTYIVDYHGVYAKRIVDVTFDLNADKPAEEIAAELNGRESEVLKTVKASVADLPNFYPNDCVYRVTPLYPFSNVSFLLHSRDYKRPGEVSFQALLRQVIRSQELLSLSQEDMDRCHEKIIQSHPNCLQVGTHHRIVFSFSIKCPELVMFSDKITIKYNFNYQERGHIYSTESTIDIPCLFAAFRQKNAGAKEEIASIIKDQIYAVFKLANENLFLLDSPAANDAVDAFYPDGIRFGNVICRCSRAIPRNTEISFFPTADDRLGVALWKNGEIKSGKYDFSMGDLLKKDQTPVNMDSKEGFPDDPIYFTKFCREVSSLYDQFAKTCGVPLSPLTFIYEENVGYTCQWRKTGVPFPASFGSGKMYEKTVKDRVLDLFAYIANQEHACEGEAHQQTEILSTLNPTELLILKNVARRGSGWAAQIKRDIADEALTKKSATKSYIDHLCNTYVTLGDKRVPLLKGNVVTHPRYGRYWLYTSPVSWIDHALQNAEPSSFTVDDLPYLTTNGKVSLFRSIVKSCDDKTRGQALIVLEQLPASFVASFANTEKGEDFCMSFTGDDIARACKLFSSIPRCKFLATKYSLRQKQTCEET